MNNYPATPKDTSSTDQEFPGFEDGNNPDELEPIAPEDGERSNLDDAIDDDNENPVGQTLIDAAENTGPQEIDETKELEGEVDEDGEES